MSPRLKQAVKAALHLAIIAALAGIVSAVLFPRKKEFIPLSSALSECQEPYLIAAPKPAEGQPRHAWDTDPIYHQPSWDEVQKCLYKKGWLLEGRDWKWMP
jgi:hypothetical protein